MAELSVSKRLTKRESDFANVAVRDASTHRLQAILDLVDVGMV